MIINEVLIGDRFYLNLWGGEHYVSLRDEIYYLKRPYGFFSNITVSIYGILKFTQFGYKPKTLSLNLLEYDMNRDFYPDLFKTSDTYFDIFDIPFEDFLRQMRLCEPNLLGVGRTKTDCNNEILNKVLRKYFVLSDPVVQHIEDIKKEYNLNCNNTVFVWARKTDKVIETSIPDVCDYIDVLNKIDLTGKDLIIQSDDYTVYEDFKKNNINYRSLNVLPIKKDNSNGFHVNLYHQSDEQFFENFGMSKVEYLQKMLALTYIASECETVILYPGNLATYIPIIRGCWNNVYSFKDKNNFIN
jgi:hypothetical protein